MADWAIKLACLVFCCKIKREEIMFWIYLIAPAKIATSNELFYERYAYFFTYSTNVV